MSTAQDGIDTGQAAALLEQLVGASLISQPVPAWSSEAGSVADLIAGLVIRNANLTRQLEDARKPVGGLSVAELSAIRGYWYPYSITQPQVNENPGDTAWRAAAQMIVNQLGVGA